MENTTFEILIVGDERDIIFDAMYAMRGDWHNGNLTNTENLNFNGLFPKLQNVLLPDLTDRINKISRISLNEGDTNSLRELIERYAPKSEEKSDLLIALKRVYCDDVVSLRRRYESSLTDKEDSL
jgi:hypothetical protein